MLLNLAKNLQSLGLETCVIADSQSVNLIKSTNNKIMVNSSNYNSNRQVSYAAFLLTKNSRKKELGFEGKTARVLLALIKAKNQGVNTFEAFKMDLHRFSGFICILRHEYNINIVTMREQVSNSWCGRYVLVDKVEVVKVFN